MSDATEDVKNLYQQVLDAWNRRDATGMAALYGRSGSQVGFDGSTANGAEQIEAHLTPIFADHPTGRFVAKIREVRELAPNAVLLRAVAGMIPPGESEINPDLNTIQTLVASRDATGRWRVEMFHNTPAAYHGRAEERDKLAAELSAVANVSHAA